MSTQPQQPQTQQPVVVYPNSVSGHALPSHSHSDGSFRRFFIVLSVIIVLSAIACFLGRLCSRRMISQTKPAKQRQKQNHNLRPKERDMELGFDGRIPTAKPDGHGDHSIGFKMPGNGDPRGFRSVPDQYEDPTGFRMAGDEDPRTPGHGDIEGETKPVDDGALRADA
ncbi:hypothetical protein PTKIN_Ptkin02bG0085000 [Pterospermum kingtungense]